jgi:hypothetical protein
MDDEDDSENSVPVTAEGLCFPLGLKAYQRREEFTRFFLQPHLKKYLDQAANCYEAYTLAEMNSGRLAIPGFDDRVPWKSKKQFLQQLKLLLNFCHMFISFYSHDYEDLSEAMSGCQEFFLKSMLKLGKENIWLSMTPM